MKKNILIIVFILFSFLLFISGIYLQHKNNIWENYYPSIKNVVRYDDDTPYDYPKQFKIVNIISSLDKENQKAIYYKPNDKSNSPMPLIVSLHSWSGNYQQRDEISEFISGKNITYIHPDFRGQNNTIDACCGNKALSDIDDAIDFAISNSNIDTNKIYVIGVSGGGFATLALFMKSKHPIKKYSAWVPISDLIQWYYESKLRKSKHANDILLCTNSLNNILDSTKAKEKSPIFWHTPKDKIGNTILNIYAGINDGWNGSVPITHSILFYNKILNDTNAPTDSLVSDAEILSLMNRKYKPMNAENKIGNRKIIFSRSYHNITLTIFEGGHEILSEYAFNSLIN